MPSKQLKSDPYWMLENDQGVVKVSFWSMGVYQTCPAQYNFLRKATKRPGVIDKRNAFEGSIVHSVIDDWFKAGDFTRTDFADMVQPAIDKFLKYEHVEWRSKTDYPEAVARIYNDLEGVYSSLKESGFVSPFTRPEITLEGFLTDSILLKGRIDLFKESPDSSSAILDAKATKNPSNLNKDQLTFYRLLCRVAGRSVPDELGWLLTYFQEVRWVNVTEADERKLEEKIHKVVAGIRERNFPYKTHKIFCGWCDFSAICPAFKAKFPNQELLEGVKSIQTSGVVDWDG